MTKIITSILILFSLAGFWSCSKKDDDDNTPAKKQYALVIRSGGQAVTVGNNFKFEAQLVGTDGTIIPVTSGITYTSSNTDVATFNGVEVYGKGEGTATITASYSYNGTTYTASVPLSIQAPSTVFAVNPWTIWWEADGTEFDLNTIYFGTTTPTYTFTSSDPTVASVTSSGKVKVLKAGSCVVTVTATNLTGSPSVKVPVLVFGEIAVPLPVTQVKITPGAYEMFKGETQVFTAKAFNNNGEVTGKTIKWWIKTTDSTDMGEAATIDQTGKVTALRVGEAAVYAEIEGIVSQANITINPDYALFIDPFSTSIGANKTQIFTLKTYKVDRAKYRANAPDAVSLVANPSNVQWLLPFNDIPGFPKPFTITSSDNNSCTLKASSSAMPGMPGFLLAFVNDDTYAAGGASVQVAVADDCDCGSNNPEVTSISVNATTVSLTAFFGTTTAAIGAVARNSSNNPVSGASIKYCSSNIQVANVDFDGTITAVQPGSAVITVCVGSIKREINVTVN